jgi:hypothetical protein
MMPRHPKGRQGACAAALGALKTRTAGSPSFFLLGQESQLEKKTQFSLSFFLKNGHTAFALEKKA